MSLEIITTPGKIRRFLVYDFEWIPGTLKMRICGVCDGKAYRHYPTVAKFLAGELTSRNRGSWFYAHAGGLADMQFVLEALVTDGSYEVKASFSGSSAIIVHVRKGNNSWHFVDSYWLLRDKLANIAKWIHMEKSGPAGEDDEEKVKEWYASVPMEQLVWYNENDCRILWHAIDAFENSLLELGGQLQMTLASCAMHLFRRAYLVNEIETSDAVNENSRLAYIASRVEVFRRNVDLTENARYYDINSSFPYAMTKPVPGNLLKTSTSLPDDALYIADVDIEVPENYLTPTPMRLGGRVYFPVGRWRGWFSNVDIRSLEGEGGRVLRVHEAMIFEPFTDLASYANDLYTKRKNAQTEMEKAVYKLLLNSLYGKFAESSAKDTLHINPNKTTLARLSPENMLFPGAWIEETIVDIPHMHVPISVHITAQARRTLFDFLAMSNDFHYCDTDGFSTCGIYSTGKELGDLKLEREMKNDDHPWEFVAPKVYRMGDKVKAKGFSLGWDEKKPAKKARAIKLFEDLIDNREIEVERMVRIRENFGKGRIMPTEAVIKKGLRGKMIPKRFTYPDGSTRPWHVDELRSMVK